MDAGNAFAAAGCLSAFCSAALTALLAIRRFGSQTRATQVVRRSGAAGEIRVLQTGIPLLRGAVQRALGAGSVKALGESMCQALALRGVSATPEGVLSCLAGAMLLVAVGGALSGRFVLGLLLAFGLAVLASFRSSHVLEAQKERMRDALPDALQSTSSCFGAGFTLLQTFEHLGEETKGPLGSLFARAAQSLQTGTPLETVLERMRDEARLRELSFVSVALAVQHQTGGSMQRVLDATRSSLKEELDLKRSLRVHTAQAKLSARVVVGVTLGLVASMMLLSRDFLAPFLSSAAGLAVLVTAVALQVAGVLAVRSMLTLEMD